MNVKFAQNFVWLACTQGAQFLFPLITIPYLTRTLLAGGYGTMVYVVAIGTIVSLVCDYGFNWTGVQEVSVHRDDKAALSRIVSNILSAKLLIFSLCGVIFTALLYILPQFRTAPELYVLSLVVAFGNASNLTWFLQGIEKMGYLAFISVTVRGLGIALMFLFIKTPADVPMAIVLTSLPGILVNGVMLMKVRKWVSGLPMPTWRETLQQLRLGWTVFSSTLFISAYTQALVLLVGFTGGVTAAAFYGLAERLLNLGKSGISVSYQAAMPQAAYLAKQRPDEGIRFISRHVMFTAPFGLVGSIILAFFGEPIIRILASPAFMAGTLPLFHILSPVPLMLGISSSFASLYMMNYGLKVQWSRMLMASCILALGAFGILQLVLPATQAAAWATVTAEGTVLLVSTCFFIGGWRKYTHGQREDAAARGA